MRVYAWMTAFTGRDGEPTILRPIDIPDELFGGRPPLEDGDPAAVLNGAFHYGQNDFQPQRCPSLSVGDVVEIPAQDGGWQPQFWRVDGVGFSPAEQPAVDALAYSSLCWPCDDEPEHDRCPDCLTGDPTHPVRSRCESCANAMADIIANAERKAGWDPNP